MATLRSKIRSCREHDDVSEFKCPECCYVFSEERGDEHEGYPPGTDFTTLPDDFACPDCAVRFRDDFEKA